MSRWQSKFLFSAVLYGAGFVTAVYFMAPHPVSAADQTQATKVSSQLQSAQTLNADRETDTKVWVTKIRSGIDTSIHFAEEHALKVADLIRSKIDQIKNDS